MLNAAARNVIDVQRRKHDVYVLPEGGGVMHRINNSAWDSATDRAADSFQLETGKVAEWGFRNLRVHDLKHTFGRRLSAARVSNETRKVLLGYANGDITTDYSDAEIEELINAAEKVSDAGVSKPTLTLFRSINMQSHAKVTQEIKMS